MIKNIRETLVKANPLNLSSRSSESDFEFEETKVYHPMGFNSITIQKKEMAQSLKSITGLDEERCNLVLDKVHWMGVQNATDYLFDRDQDGLLLLHEFCPNVGYNAPVLND